MTARSSTSKRAPRAERMSAPQSKRGGRVVPLHKARATIMAARAIAFDEGANTLTLGIGTSEVSARLDPSVSPVVVRGALERGETLIVVDDDGEFVVIGALRTAPTPGVDKADQYVIEANRLELRGEDRVAIISGAAQLLVSGIDRIEMLATDITSRALRVHKLIGRMLALN